MEERQAFSTKLENPHMYKNGLTMSVCWQVMVVEVKLSRSLEKRVSFPTTLIGFFWVIRLWYLICTGLCLSLPGMDAGVCSHTTLWRGEESDVQGWLQEHMGVVGLVGEMCLHCTARMATDPEIAGVWYKNTPQKALYKMTVLLLRKFKLTEWNRESESIFPKTFSSVWD